MVKTVDIRRTLRFSRFERLGTLGVRAPANSSYISRSSTPVHDNAVLKKPTSTTSPYGAVTSYTYNDAASPPTKTATTDNRAVITSMDGFGRPIRVHTVDTGVVKSIVDTQYAPLPARLWVS